MKTRIFITLLILLTPWLIVAQSLNITGQVMDESGQPLPNANVYLTDLNAGTFTDNKGKFKLKVPDSGNNVLCISYVGYQKIFRAVERESDHFEIQMEPAIVLLDEVIIQPAPEELMADLIGIIEESENKNSALIQAYMQLFEVDKNFEILSRAFEKYLERQASIK